MEEQALIGGKYRVSRRIGEGAMGVVWAAVNELTGRDVALKLIARHGLPADMLRTRLLREARACGRIAHRNVVEILDVGQTDRGDPFLVMPLLKGETLEQRLYREKRLPPLEAARIVADVARGLASAHAAGIVHRDLKPANIFMHHEPGLPEPVVKVLDFGVSKILTGEEVSTTSLGVALGSPGYMSPEQVRAQRSIDHRTDLWTLGVVLFEAIAGERPFKGTAPVRVMADVIGGPVPDLAREVRGVDRRLAALVAHCLERDVGRRVRSAGEVLAVLDPLLAEARARGAPLDLRPVPETAGELPPGDDDDATTANLRNTELAGRSDALTLLMDRGEAQAARAALPAAERAAARSATLSRGRLSVFVAAGALAGAVTAVVMAMLLTRSPRTVTTAVSIAPAARIHLTRREPAAPATSSSPEEAAPAIAVPVAPSAGAASPPAPESTTPSRPATTNGARPRPAPPRTGPLELPSDPG